MKTIGKREVIYNVWIENNSNLSRREITEVVENFISVVKRCVRDGARIELRGFGVFTLRHRRAHIGRNPLSGQNVKVPAKDRPHFKISEKFLEKSRGES